MTLTYNNKTKMFHSVNNRVRVALTLVDGEVSPICYTNKHTHGIHSFKRVDNGIYKAEVDGHTVDILFEDDHILLEYA